MKRVSSINKTFLLACLLSVQVASHSQDTAAAKSYFDSLGLEFDSIRLTNFNDLFSSIGPFKVNIGFHAIYHSAEKEDSDLYKNNKALINGFPDDNNYETYYQLACALWELEKTKLAEKMFLRIVRSNNKHYTNTYYHSSDVPGDTATNTYGYGSFTSSYKNSACIMLCKIYIEQKRFQEALIYLNDAVRKYKVSYSCGTGYNQQKNQYDFLYATCYAGLNQNKKVLDILLPDCIDRYDEMITNAIKKMYSAKQIKEYLLIAERSLKCKVDDFSSLAWTTENYGEENERSDTIHYYSGTGTTRLFGRIVTLPRPDLKDGETVTRDHFMKLFKESEFYEALHKENKISSRKPGTLTEDL